MLPLNSPRWANLKVCIGYAQHIADELQCVYDELDADPRDDGKLAAAIEQMLLQFEDLDHQQTTYTAAGAAVPHYVQLLPRLKVATQVNLLWIIATMHYDGAGSRLKRTQTRTAHEKETQFDDLAKWYDKAILEAEQFAVMLARDKNISIREFHLFEAIANFRGDNSTYYLLRDCCEYRFMCPRCDENLTASQTNANYQICRDSDGDEVVAVFALPSGSLEDSISQPYYASLLPYYEMMISGNRTELLGWLAQLLGKFQCPTCKQDSFIAYDDFFRR